MLCIKKKKACPAKENFSSSSIMFSRTIWWSKISNLKNKFLTELDPQLILKNHTENKNYIWAANSFSSFCFQALPTYFNNPLSVLKGHKQTHSNKVKISKKTK